MTQLRNYKDYSTYHSAILLLQGNQSLILLKLHKKLCNKLINYNALPLGHQEVWRNKLPLVKYRTLQVL
jgi:hypothetical protein